LTSFSFFNQIPPQKYQISVHIFCATQR
jgi:hypothetical protein